MAKKCRYSRCIADSQLSPQPQVAGNHAGQVCTSQQVCCGCGVAPQRHTQLRGAWRRLHGAGVVWQQGCQLPQRFQAAVKCVPTGGEERQAPHKQPLDTGCVEALRPQRRDIGCQITLQLVFTYSCAGSSGISPAFGSSNCCLQLADAVCAEALLPKEAPQRQLPGCICWGCVFCKAATCSCWQMLQSVWGPAPLGCKAAAVAGAAAATP